MTRLTLARSVSVEGIGIHTGTHARVTLSPAPFGAGIVFRSCGVEIPAHVDYVVDTSRCTVLGKDGVTISTVEHLMSAIASIGVGDAYVDVDGAELPIGDGSADLWVDALMDADDVSNGVSDASQTGFAPTSTLRVDGKNGSYIEARAAKCLSIRVTVQFDHPMVGTQTATFSDCVDNWHDYSIAVAPARTFGFIEEVEALRKAGLALGGSEENAVVVYPDRYSKPLRFPNELAVHKLLDLMGDLALAGLPLPNLEIVAVKPSHRLNVEFAKLLVSRALPPVALTPQPPLSSE